MKFYHYLTMIPKVLKYLTLVLLLSQYSLAYIDVFWMMSSGTGCTGSVSTYSTGFDVTIYDFPVGDDLNFLDDNWVADSYRTEGIDYITSGVTEPNFYYLYNLLNPYEDIYGFSGNILYLIVQLTGYFKRMSYL